MASLTGHVSHYTEEVAAERACKRPSAPSESDDHRNESTSGCALQETLERVSCLKDPRGHQYTLLFHFTR
jgi:hypothetical protein